MAPTTPPAVCQPAAHLPSPGVPSAMDTTGLAMMVIAGAVLCALLAPPRPRRHRQALSPPPRAGTALAVPAVVPARSTQNLVEGRRR